jgi:arylsulfatase B
MLGGLLTVAAAAANTAAAAKQPHILMILVDDLGHAELGYHRPPAYKEVVTPEIDELVRTGAQLDRFYVHKFCSPTRCAIQTGRAPIHVNVINAAPEVHNASDPISGFAGIPRNMTGVAEVMRRAGYSTHYAGKWDTGMATPDHTPAGRGYDSSLFCECETRTSVGCASCAARLFG